MSNELLALCRLFFEAGLAIGFAFILGFALGLFTMGWLKRREKSGKE